METFEEAHKQAIREFWEWWAKHKKVFDAMMLSVIQHNETKEG